MYLSFNKMALRQDLLKTTTEKRQVATILWTYEKGFVWLETSSTEQSGIKSIGNDVLIKPSKSSISSNSKFLFICKLFLTVTLKAQ